MDENNVMPNNAIIASTQSAPILGRRRAKIALVRTDPAKGSASFRPRGE
jgi:hypothetical protein